MVIGNVIGSTISFGTPVEFSAIPTNFTLSRYNTDTNKVLIVYNSQVGGTERPGKVIVGTVSGTTISFEPETVFNSIYVNSVGSVWDPVTNSLAIVFTEADLPATRAVGVAWGDTNRVEETTNLTEENYIGVALQSVADGESVEVATLGKISPDQTGLTPGRLYYVQPDGSLDDGANTLSEAKAIVEMYLGKYTGGLITKKKYVNKISF